MIVRLMMAVIAIVAISFVFSFLKRYLKTQTKQQQKSFLFKFGFIVLCGVLLILIVTGRVHWISAIFAALIPVTKYIFPILLRLLPALLSGHKGFKKFQSSGPTSFGENSTIQTVFLKLILDQKTGAIQGEVLSGLFNGRKLAELEINQIKELLSYYLNKDRESYNLLQAYTQRRFEGHSFGNEETYKNNTSNSNITRKEALDILGLDPSASPEDIILAHKKLMQKMHPDRGGSNYLAAKINEAKDFLIP